MLAEDIAPADLAALDVLLDEQLLPIVVQAFEDGHDVDLQVDRQDGAGTVLVHVLDGERIVSLHEFTIDAWHRLPRHLFSRLLGLHLECLRRHHARRQAETSRRLRALGLEEPPATPRSRN